MGSRAHIGRVGGQQFEFGASARRAIATRVSRRSATTPPRNRRGDTSKQRVRPPPKHTRGRSTLHHNTTPGKRQHRYARPRPKRRPHRRRRKWDKEHDVASTRRTIVKVGRRGSARPNPGHPVPNGMTGTDTHTDTPATHTRTDDGCRQRRASPTQTRTEPSRHPKTEDPRNRLRRGRPEPAAS